MDALIERLTMELAERQSNNSNYSLRAFARDLDINLTSLSTIIAKKRRPSKKLRETIANKLSLAPSYSQPDLLSLDQLQDRNIKDDEFHLIAEWHHLAMLNLLREGLPPKSIPELAKRLDLPKSVVIVAIDRLQRLGYVVEEKGRYRRIVKPIQTSQDLPSSAIRKLHTGILDLSKEALQRVPVQKREYSATFLMVKESSLPKAKELIRRMRADLISICDPTSKAPKDSQLYAFAIQLFPLDKETKKEDETWH